MIKNFSFIYLVLGLCTIALFMPLVLPNYWTYMYADEVKQIAEHNYLIWSDVGEVNWQGLELVTTQSFGARIKEVSCPKCPSYGKTLNVNVKNIFIIWHTPNHIKFQATIEVAEIMIDKSSGEVSVSCNGFAETGTYNLVKEDNVWKTDRADYVELDINTPVEVLRANICP